MDPNGKAATDMWLYKSDGSDPAKLFIGLKANYIQAHRIFIHILR